jgi:hypothetical protein
LMVPQGSSFESVIVSDEKGQTNQKPDIESYDDREEAGILVDIPSGGEKIVTFNWSLPKSVNLQKNGRILFGWRKQSGIESYPINLEFLLPQNSKISFSSDNFLTFGDFISYNTSLSEDVEASLQW